MAETSSTPTSTAPAAEAPAPAANAASASAQQPAPAQAQDQAQPAKKPTGAEIKAKKQAEKAARRAQAIQAKTEKAASAPGGPAAPGGAAQAGTTNKGGAKPKGKTEAGGKPAARRPSGVGAKPTLTPPAPPKQKDPRDTIPECFSHLPMAKRIPLSQADKDVHPVVLAVGQQMATFALRDNIRRLEATLNAFKKVSWPVMKLSISNTC